MGFNQWLLVLGGILLTLGLTSAYLRLLPVSSSLLYLLFGLAIGPLGLDLWQADIGRISPWLEHLAEATLLISLFIGGLRMRQSLRSPVWTATWQLAGPVLLGCIAGSAALAHYLLGLDWGLALLVAAILSPTDPVLASIVQVDDASDDDGLRYGLSGEAGLNDGVAFPFVGAAFLLVTEPPSGAPALLRQLPHWLLLDVLWAIPAGLLTGYCLGYGVGRLAIHLRARHTDTSVSANDFLAMALIALSYVGAESLGGWGFLACFAAGIGLRHAEVATIGKREDPAEAQAEAAHIREAGQAHGAIAFGEDRSEHPRVAAGAVMLDILSFGDLLERSLALLLVTLLGALLANHWDWRALPLALGLFCLLRPALVWLLVTRRALAPRQRWLLGWFGIRGIGSLFYLCHVLNQADAPRALGAASDLVLSVVALSICLHGLTTQPLLDRYERAQLSCRPRE
ncbi:sodium:proton antiporter [Pseudomonas delhiensis]|uniref:cation:proton antiporter n=1 Tax=Pseudomonas delhiensis TaxID=366289 RepID=UPI00315B2B3B